MPWYNFSRLVGARKKREMPAVLGCGTCSFNLTAHWDKDHEGNIPESGICRKFDTGVLRQRAAYYGGYRPAAVTSDGGRPHYAVTAYYAGGPWYGYSGWDDYAARNSIKCKPGGTVKLD